MRGAALGFLLVIACALGCDNDRQPQVEGPCGDPVVECWTADSTLPGCSCGNIACYKRYQGSGKCPAGYWCVDPRLPIADASAICPHDLARNND
jgi:hypothetical protein